MAEGEWWLLLPRGRPDSQGVGESVEQCPLNMTTRGGELEKSRLCIREPRGISISIGQWAGRKRASGRRQVRTRHPATAMNKYCASRTSPLRDDRNGASVQARDSVGTGGLDCLSASATGSECGPKGLPKEEIRGAAARCWAAEEGRGGQIEYSIELHGMTCEPR
ncbi:hypothetical protein BC567DRAFT_225835 [Phyllosticta citribraziliensis]